MNNSMTLSLGECLTIAQVQDVYDQLGELLLRSTGSELELDASTLVKIDATGAQLIIAFIHAATVSKKTVKVSNPTPVLVDSFKVLGLTNELDGFLAEESRED